MKLKQRFLSYILLAILYFFSTLFFMFIDGKLMLNEVFITVPCGLVLINIAYAFLIVKLKPFLNILSALIIPFLSLFLALKFSDLHLFSLYDAYDITTAIIANSIFPILLWEIIYQVKKKSLIKNKPQNK